MKWLHAGFLALLAIAATTVTLSGCGGALPPGPKRFEISGEVTFAGKPLPYGELIFEPDSAQGNSGPATVVVAEKGRYAASATTGIIGGPMIVRIVGWDGVQPAGEEGELQPHGRQLFGNYVEAVTFPKEASKHDFAVPEKAK